MISTIAVSLWEIFLQFTAIYAGLWLLLIGHEMGHAIGGWLTGMRLVEMRLGSGDRAWKFKVGTAEFQVYAGPFGGWVLCVPDSLKWFRFRELILTAGGPVASFAMTALLLYAHRMSSEGHFSQWLHLPLQLGMFYSIGQTVNTIWPRTLTMYGRAGDTDGLIIWKLLTRPHEVMGHSVLPLLERAWLKHQAGEVEEAKSIAHEVTTIRLPEEQWELRNYVAQYVYAFGLIDEAIDALHSMLKTPAPNDADFASAVDGFASYTLFAGRQKWFDEAEKLLREALVKCPEVITLKGTLGGLLFEKGETAESLPLLESLYAESSEPVDRGISAAYLAVHASSKNDEAAAERFATEARKATPENAHVVHLLGRIKTTQPAS